MDRLRELLSTCFFLGYSPIAPGTAGTLGALAAAFLLLLLPESLPYGAAAIALVLLSLALGVPLGRWAEGHHGKKDPGAFVLDEFMGFFVPLCYFFHARPAPDELFAAFLLFRLFDVAKPPPARRLEGLEGGWGIMLDDLIAGLYALIGITVYHSIRLNPVF